MTNSVYIQNAQQATRAMRDAFLKSQLDTLPSLSNDYTLALLELIQAEGHWAIGSESSISLEVVAEQILGHRTKEGYSLFDGRDGARIAAAFVEFLPLTTEHARTLISRSEPPMDRLVTKLMKMNFDYPISSVTGICDLAQTIATKSKVQGDRFITDILNGKTHLGRSADLQSMMFLFRVGLSNEKPSESLLAAVKAQESLILKQLAIGDSSSKIRSINETVKLPVKVLTNLKVAGCDDLLGKILNLRSVDYGREGALSGFFAAGGRLPYTFVSGSLASPNLAPDLRFVFAEALATTPANLHAAVRFVGDERANDNAEVWLKSLGDALVLLGKEGLEFDRKQVVDLIEPIAASIENRAILKGAALASGIDGIYLAAVPSLKEFKGEFIHQELGL